ncbi:hypothetical protein PBY51_004614 [Eleginops maclovinus]|uniref:Uncharacterized protein n=1 Tax=Eleginops maclovinus TaxID=56733 RepID=A0AAN8ATJ6_ELEMC|nr:hypothetical protein PBY51_004614 [Eleginops maclovinus]
MRLSGCPAGRNESDHVERADLVLGVIGRLLTFAEGSVVTAGREDLISGLGELPNSRPERPSDRCHCPLSRSLGG